MTEPTGVWVRFASARFHYAWSHPPDWDIVTTINGYDAFEGPAGELVAATRYKSGMTLNELLTATVRFETAHGLAKDSSEAFSIAGVRARFVTYHATVAGPQAGNWTVQFEPKHASVTNKARAVWEETGSSADGEL